MMKSKFLLHQEREEMVLLLEEEKAEFHFDDLHDEMEEMEEVFIF